MAHLSHMTSLSRNKLKAAEEALTHLCLLKKAPGVYVAYLVIPELFIQSLLSLGYLTNV